MKIKSWQVATVIAVAFALVGTTAQAQETYKIDPVHSTVIFSVSHFGAGKVFGMFRAVNGEFTIGKKAADSKVAVEIDAKSVFTAEQKRDTHLMSPDFLNVKEFPKITFVSKSVKGGGSSYAISGNLTLHGVTKPVTIKMKKLGQGKDPWNNVRVGFEGKLVIKRSQYGIKGMPGAAGENVELILAVEGIKQ